METYHTSKHITSLINRGAPPGNMDRKLAIGYTVAAMIAMIVFTVYGLTTSMPDNVYTRHGLPFAWGTHQTVTIAGPVDTWTVRLNTLVGDLVFWSAVALTGPLMLTRGDVKEKPGID
jgi:uncharacterized membrane-anchored protein